MRLLLALRLLLAEVVSVVGLLVQVLQVQIGQLELLIRVLGRVAAPLLSPAAASCDGRGPRAIDEMGE